MTRARRIRLAVLLALMSLLAGWLAGERSGVAGRFAAAPGALDGRLELEHGVSVERVRLSWPLAQLIVARIPRRAGLRLVATRLAWGAPLVVLPPGGGGVELR